MKMIVAMAIAAIAANARVQVSTEQIKEYVERNQTEDSFKQEKYDEFVAKFDRELHKKSRFQAALKEKINYEEKQQEMLQDYKTSFAERYTREARFQAALKEKINYEAKTEEMLGEWKNKTVNKVTAKARFQKALAKKVDVEGYKQKQLEQFSKDFMSPSHQKLSLKNMRTNVVTELANVGDKIGNFLQ